MFDQSVKLVAAPPAGPASSDLAGSLADKLERLRDAVASCGSALVCFSGGVDSMLLLRVAADVLGERCVAMTAVSQTMAASERRGAAELAALVACRHEIIESHEMERPGFAANPTNRCYHCKAELMELAQPLASRLGLAWVLLGTNRDDLGDHRPGLSAANERGARHPLVEAGLDKSEVRALVAGAGACRPGTSLSWPACRRAFRTGPRSRRRACARSTTSRMRSAPWGPPAAGALSRRDGAPRGRRRGDAARARRWDP